MSIIAEKEGEKKAVQEEAEKVKSEKRAAEETLKKEAQQKQSLEKVLAEKDGFVNMLRQ